MSWARKGIGTNRASSAYHITLLNTEPFLFDTFIEPMDGDL
jgi:hypothetical protein